MASIKEYYEKYWEQPEEYDDPSTPVRLALIRKHAASLPKGAKVLDVGCGRGEFCAAFREAGWAPEGIDISETGIAYAQKQYPDIPFHAVTIEDFAGTRENSFDMAFSSEVIEHLFDVMAYLQAVQRVLKPGGLLLLTTPFHGPIKTIAIDLFHYHQHYDPVGQHIRFFNTPGLRRCLQDAGFSVEVVTGYGRPWPFWKSFFVVARKTNPGRTS